MRVKGLTVVPLLRRVLMKTARTFLPFFAAFTAVAVILVAASCHAQTPTPTKTLLFFSPSASVSVGTVLTVSATVNAAGKPVHPGLVLFCNAAAPRCEGSAILAQAQLPVTGKASVHLRFGIGTYSIKAVFSGITHTSAQSPTLRAASASAVQVLTVKSRGLAFTQTSIDESAGTTSTYNFTSTVTSFNGPAPQGNLTFEDISAGTIPLATVPLSSGAKGVQFNYLGAFTDTEDADQVNVADFNGDGIPDVVADYHSGGSLTVSLGRSDGSLMSVYTAQFGNIGGGLTVADFNSDGIPDLAVGDASTGTDPCCSVSILIGKGDGAFTLQSQFPVGHGNLSLASGDFNGDGIPDLAVTNHDDSTLTIALGVGDGSFTTPLPIALDGEPFALTAADFNGDGSPDIAAIINRNSGPSSIEILLSNGDGTFTAGTVTLSGSDAYGIAANDLDGDGILDLSVTDATSGTVTTFKGDGRGGFNTPLSIVIGNSAKTVKIADFDGDGIPDLAVSGLYNNFAVLFGAGDRTFSITNAPFRLDSTALSFVVADFNDDGVPDLVSAFDNYPAMKIEDMPSVTVSLNGQSFPVFGRHAITASYSGDNTLPPSKPFNPVFVDTYPPVPVVIPSSGAYPGTVTLTITDVAPNAAIYYQIGPYNSPSNQTILYTGPFQLPPPSGSQTAVEFAAYASVSCGQGCSVGSPVENEIYYTPYPTQTTLSVAPGASIQAGTPVTLIAHVTGVSTPFHNGIVLFCNAVAAHCEDSAILGSAKLTAGGTAKLHLRLGVGSYNIRAVFQGTYQVNNLDPTQTQNFNAPSTSTVQPLTVKGQSITTTTSINAAQVDGVYNFTSRVSAFSRASIAGTLSIRDSVNGGPSVLLGSIILNPANTVVGLTTAAPIVAGRLPNTIAVADFNQDGIPDAVTGNYDENTLSILQGNGDGTFTAKSKITVSASPDFVAVGDLNGDGIPDIVVTTRSTNSLTILLGNTNGTFTQKTTLTVTGGPLYTTVADLDGDGVLDIATANIDSGTITVFLGSDDGNFMSLSDISVPGKPVSLAVADFNHDGIADLAASNEDGTVSILLGTGNTSYPYLGSVAFYAASSLNPGGSGTLVTGDFNGDGVPDLAAPGSNGLTIYLANGDGTFAFKTSLAMSHLHSLSVADFNSDGKSDLAITETIGNQIETVVFLGAGDGTFPRTTTPKVTPFYKSTVIADFNGDGIPDLAGTNPSNNSVGVLLGNQTTTGAIHNIMLLMPGTHVITPTYSGTSTLASSVGPPLTLVVAGP